VLVCIYETGYSRWGWAQSLLEGWSSATQWPTPVRAPILDLVYTRLHGEVGTHGRPFARGTEAKRNGVATPSLVYRENDALLPAEVLCLGLAGEAVSSTSDDRLW
jgi:hypothetical protein